MKMVNPNFSFEIELKENSITNLVIECPRIFEEIIMDIYNQISGIEGTWVLSEDSTLIDIKKISEVIINPFALDINNKRILGKLYDIIKKNALGTELFIKWNEMYPYIIDMIELITKDFDYTLEFDDEYDIKEFLKFVNLRFINEDMGSLEKLIDYMNLHNKILGINFFILINIRSYYSQEKLKFLYEQAFYNKYKLLLIDNQEYKKEDINVIRYLIDRDGCVII